MAKLVSAKKSPIGGDALQLTWIWKTVSRGRENGCEGSQAGLISLYYRVTAELQCARGKGR